MSVQPEMLPTTTILELSQKHANLVNRNGDYTVEFTEPQTIKAGDQLNIKMVAIDSQDADSESIVLPLDGLPVATQQGRGTTSLSIGYSFYDMNYDLVNGYATGAQLERQKFVTGVQAESNPYPVDYQPYQPYGAIDERTLNSMDLIFSRKYSNGKSGFNDRLDNYQVKVGFSWYSLEDDGSHLFHKSDFATDDYVYLFFDDFTVKNGKPVSIKNRPSSIALKTPVSCKPTSTPIKFIKGSLQIAQISFVVRNAVPNLNTPIPTALQFLKFKSQDDSSSLFSTGIAKIRTTGGNLTVDVTLETAPAQPLSQGDHVSISGITDADVASTGAKASQYNGTHVVENVAGTTFEITLTGTAPTATVAPISFPAAIVQLLGRIQLVTATTTIQIPNGRYDRESITAALTKAFSIVHIGSEGDQFSGSPEFKPSTNLQFRPEDSPYGGVRFRKMDQIRPNDSAVDGQIEFTSTNSYNYKFAITDGNTNANPIIGARKFAFDYGEDGNVFRWIDGHQAICDPAEAKKNPPLPSEAIGFFQSSDNLYYQVNAATGIIISDMEPKTFWQDIMGLYNNIIEPLQFGTDVDNKTMSYVPYDCLRFKVPTESSPLNGFSVSNTRTQLPETGTSATPTPTAPLFVDTAGIPTNAVDGETPLVIGAGFYLVEILSLNLAQSNLIDNNENRGNISAIVSTQYNANDSITGFADSGIPYIHRGSPAIIASANVRILDPDTKQVPLNLGNRNTVFLQLSSEAPVYTPAEVAPNEAKPTQTQLRGGA